MSLKPDLDRMVSLVSRWGALPGWKHLSRQSDMAPGLVSQYVNNVMVLFCRKIFSYFLTSNTCCSSPILHHRWCPATQFNSDVVYPELAPHSTSWSLKTRLFLPQTSSTSGVSMWPTFLPRSLSPTPCLIIHTNKHKTSRKWLPMASVLLDKTGHIPAGVAAVCLFRKETARK